MSRHQIRENGFRVFLVVLVLLTSLPAASVAVWLAVSSIGPLADAARIDSEIQEQISQAPEDLDEVLPALAEARRSSSEAARSSGLRALVLLGLPLIFALMASVVPSSDGWVFRRLALPLLIGLLFTSIVSACGEWCWGCAKGFAAFFFVLGAGLGVLLGVAIVGSIQLLYRRRSWAHETLPWGGLGLFGWLLVFSAAGIAVAWLEAKGIGLRESETDNEISSLEEQLRSLEPFPSEVAEFKSTKKRLHELIDAVGVVENRRSALYQTLEAVGRIDQEELTVEALWFDEGRLSIGGRASEAGAPADFAEALQSAMDLEPESVVLEPGTEEFQIHVDIASLTEAASRGPEGGEISRVEKGPES